MPDSIATRLDRLERQLAQITKGQRLAHGASIEDAAIQVRDDTGSLRAIVGQQGDGTTGIQVVNGPPPPQPTAPILGPVLGGVTASWDGQFTDGATLPLDWARLEVHASPDSGFTPLPDTLISTIETAQGATVVPAGPAGPAAVVATDILDGIVTTVKLADDAVTKAKVATGAIGTTEITDGAITTPKVVTGAIQADQIAASAVSAGKIAAGAVTTEKLDALAVTADKIAANTITAGKIAAGAVDATALKADAITGKTITGGTITGSTLQTDVSGQRITINESGANRVLVYNAAGTVIGSLDAAGLALIGDSGARITIEPNFSYPRARFTNASNTNGATVGAVENGLGQANIGLWSGTFNVAPLTNIQWRTFLGEDFWASERLSLDTAQVSGGRVFLDPGYGSFGYRDDVTGTSTSLQVHPAFASLSTRLRVLGQANEANALLFVQSGTGHTGAMFRLYNTARSKDVLRVEENGDTSITGTLTAGNIATGSVVITPSAANTPTSMQVNYNVTGSTVRGFATANSTVPGVRAPAGAAGVTGVSVSAVTNTSMQVWVNRENTTNTTINWMVIGS
ncbi:hypothetical protein [Streptomyces sp. NEAU-H3]|uniref:hypothetical protein n=1 Tax=Streptomyces sp. NEAU-H3 TaxID=2720636 RepID=UPI00143BEFAF|nr:hypothetical protein [Streptomyces sp. NEAU-H3]NJA56750.1 hypothetical protein [Streptomyces sp. NEAU-H3]